jgi:glycosyltransferase involved in cell wall biosynthesis
MNNIKVSIITVSYNSASTIKDTIRSVIGQTYNNVEYIVVDGASEDETKNIIGKYSKEVDIFISEPDKGIYDAMNKGIKMSSGEIIGILNSDDVFFDENVLCKVVSQFQEDSIEAVYGDLYYVDSNNLNKIRRYWKSSEFIRGSFAKGWHPPHPSFFVKRNVYEKYGKFDISIKISSDFELMLRFLERYNVKSLYIPEVLVKMRSGGESSTIENIVNGIRGILMAFDKNSIKVNKILFLLYRFTPKIIQIIRGRGGHN